MENNCGLLRDYLRWNVVVQKDAQVQEAEHDVLIKALKLKLLLY